MPSILSEPWMLWGAAIILALPILIITLGELADDAQLKPEYRAFTKPLLITRNSVVPLAFGALLLRQVAGLPSSNIAVKIVDTALWIIVLNAAVAFLNIMLFNEDSKSAGKVRIPRLLLDIMRFIFVVCGAAITISTIWGVNLGSLITALGVGSVVIGLALQDTLGSLFAGIAMVSARQFRAGDWVRFGTEEGVIVSQNWRTVTIKTRAGDALVIPNGIIARSPITLIAGGTGDAILLVELRFPYQYPPDTISKLLADAALETKDFYLTPPPIARVAAFDENGARFIMAVRAKDPGKIYAVRGEYLANVWYLCQRRGFSMLGQFNTRYMIPAEELPPPAATSADLLAKVQGLKEFSYHGSDLTDLLRHGRLERYRDGQPLVDRGAVSASVHILTSGRVRAVRTNDLKEDVVLHNFEPGQFILTKATLRGAQSPLAVKSSGEAEVITIPVADFKTFCASSIDRAREFEQILSAREDAAQRTLNKLSTDVTAREGDRSNLVRELFR